MAFPNHETLYSMGLKVFPDHFGEFLVPVWGLTGHFSQLSSLSCLSTTLALLCSIVTKMDRLLMETFIFLYLSYLLSQSMFTGGHISPSQGMCFMGGPLYLSLRITITNSKPIWAMGQIIWLSLCLLNPFWSWHWKKGLTPYRSMRTWCQ